MNEILYAIYRGCIRFQKKVHDSDPYDKAVSVMAYAISMCGFIIYCTWAIIHKNIDILCVYIFALSLIFLNIYFYFSLYRHREEISNMERRFTNKQENIMAGILMFLGFIFPILFMVICGLYRIYIQ